VCGKANAKEQTRTVAKAARMNSFLKSCCEESDLSPSKEHKPCNYSATSIKSMPNAKQCLLAKAVRADGGAQPER